MEGVEELDSDGIFYKKKRAIGPLLISTLFVHWNSFHIIIMA